LVQQRLEQVVVGTVDQRDRNRLASQRLGGFETAEAAADDDDAGDASVGCHALK